MILLARYSQYFMIWDAKCVKMHFVFSRLDKIPENVGAISD